MIQGVPLSSSSFLALCNILETEAHDSVLKDSKSWF